MNVREYLLTCAAEECAEIAQRISKALRFTLDEVQPGQPLSNGERIVQELRDLLVVFDVMEAKEILSLDDLHNHAAREAKYRKLESYMTYAATRGTLDLSADEPVFHEWRRITDFTGIGEGWSFQCAKCGSVTDWAGKDYLDGCHPRPSASV